MALTFVARKRLKASQFALNSASCLAKSPASAIHGSGVRWRNARIAFSNSPRRIGRTKWVRTYTLLQKNGPLSGPGFFWRCSEPQANDAPPIFIGPRTDLARRTPGSSAQSRQGTLIPKITYSMPPRHEDSRPILDTSTVVNAMEFPALRQQPSYRFAISPTVTSDPWKIV